MRGSAITSVLHSDTCGALPLMAHPHRWPWKLEGPIGFVKEYGTWKIVEF
jgi:hypothetical protein